MPNFTFPLANVRPSAVARFKYCKIVSNVENKAPLYTGFLIDNNLLKYIRNCLTIVFLLPPPSRRLSSFHPTRRTTFPTATSAVAFYFFTMKRNLVHSTVLFFFFCV